MSRIASRDIPNDERLVSEKFRLAAIAFVELDGAARMLEACRDVVLSQMIQARNDMPVARAERAAKSSTEWAEYIRKMVEARTAANMKKVEMEFYKMRHMESTSFEANMRHEARLSR